jgi:hypothetical protein
MVSKPLAPPGFHDFSNSPPTGEKFGIKSQAIFNFAEPAAARRPAEMPDMLSRIEFYRNSHFI